MKEKTNKQKKNKLLIGTENRLVIIKGEGGWRLGKMDKGGQLYGDGW